MDDRAGLPTVRWAAAMAAGALVTVSPYAYCAPVITNTFGSTKLIDFSQDEVVAGTNKTDVGVLVGEQVLWSSTDHHARANYKAAVILGRNGFWNGAPTAQNGITFSSAFATTGGMATMLFEFAAPVSGVGAFMSYGFPRSRSEPYPVKLMALDEFGGLLEEFDIVGDAPISSNGLAYHGEFRGFSRQTADIYGFALAGSVVLDNLVLSRDFAAAAVPLPGTFPLVLAALGVCFVAHRPRVRVITPCATA